jgi:membrane associated rhomboid family serine protease
MSRDNPDSSTPGSRAPQSGPRASEPMFNLPGVVLALCVVLALVHTVREFLPDATDTQLVSALAFVPARLSLWLDPSQLDDILRAGMGTQSGLNVASRVQMVRLMLLDHDNALWSMLTYGLLHGSWVHLVSNLLWLAAFGTPVARRLGPVRFLVLMMLATIAGALAHWWAREFEVFPMVGASAAIAGAMAGAARFVFSPGFRFGGIATDAEARAIPAEPLFGLWRNGRAMGFIVIWFVTNTLFGSGLIPIAGEEASIAWQAHVGGFLAGLLLFPLLDRGAVRN